MKVKVGISNRHIHLTKDDYDILFGNEIFSKRNDLSQPGMFASNLTVTIKGSKAEITNVRVLGPLRNYTQVEVSKTDCYKLGIDAPIRDSGDLSDASLIIIKSVNNEIERKSLIIPTRHIHITPDDQKKYNLYNNVYKVKISNEKGGILDNVHLKVSNDFKFELHLDTDDANAFLLNQNDELEIIE